MLRSAFHRSTFNKSLMQITKPNTGRSLPCVRHQSSFGQSGSSLKIGLLVGASVVIGSGGAAAYAYNRVLKLEDELSKQRMNDQNLTKQMKTLQRQLSDAKDAERLASERLMMTENKLSEDTKDIKITGDISDEKIKDGKIEISPEDDQYGEIIDDPLRVSLEEKYQRMVKKVREELDEEVRHHLKRQLAAHHDHLHEQLKILTLELNRKHQTILEDTVLHEKLKFQSNLRDSLNRLETIEAILKVRDQLDKEERAAKELWIVCQTLIDALKHAPDIKGDHIPRSLAKEVSAVKETLKEYSYNNLLASLAIDSIPNEALQKGVYSEDDLINRFTKIERLCRRVALIGDDGGSIFKYFLSYLQSFLIFGDPKVPIEELSNQEIDPTQWDTFDILARVKHCLQLNNLEMALRYANQLKGEPRNVAKDWICDARVHLETKQAANILLTQAATISAQVIK